MALPEKRKGELFVLAGIALWALFPVLTALSYARLPSLVVFGWSAVFATLFLGCVVVYRGVWREYRNRELWRYLFFITAINAVLYYVLYFLGLEGTTPGNAALIAQFEIFTTFLFFNVLKKEHISPHHIVGGILMLIGVMIVLAPNFSHFNRGDILVLLAQVCAPLGNFYQQKARKIASSETILFFRTICSVPVIFLLAHIFGQSASFTDVGSSLLILVVIGVLLLGLQKIFFLEAIHRVAISRVMALGALGPFLTLLLAWAILAQTPTTWQLLALVPLGMGTLLLTNQLRLQLERHA